ncbi:hypothetical protein WJX84_008204 [Apatococcus fuscideae]|uniref:Uncharacterized protein n=1 Tax=Apatococcus fuscideae TaxID=2026836 RepID=A0AAW1T0V1_9CHLO
MKRAADPAAVNACLLVAFGDTATVAATLYLQPQVVQLLQGYLFWLAENFVAPQFSSILGTPLGPISGGMLANRSIYQWLYGWVDPVLASSLGADNPVAQVALQFAWQGQGAPEARFGVPTTQLSPSMSPLIGSRRVKTGKARDTIPSEILLANGQPVVTTFPDTLPPLGNITVAGADNGLTFGLAVVGTSSQLVFDGTLGRPVNTTETGISQDVKGVKAEQWTLAMDAISPCNLSDWHSAASSRCAFPDNIQGAWNQTQIYACPSILTLARFNRADPALAASTGNNMSANNASHGWTYAMEMTTGYSISGAKTFQLSHEVKPTDIFYKNLWMSPESPKSMWFPSFWVRSRYEPSDHDARSLANILRIRSLIITFLTYVAPGLSGALLLPAAWFLVLCPAAKERRATMEMLCKSRARRLRLKIRHAYKPGPRFGVPRLQPNGKLPPLPQTVPSPAEIAVKMLQNPLEALSASSAQVEKVPMVKAAFGALGQLSGT